jgi:fatty acid desaturase
LNNNKDVISNLSKLEALKSVSAILFEWTLILACFYGFYLYEPFIFLLIPLIATRMYALYTLLHEGIHYLLYPNKFINDLIATIFLASPLFLSFKKMRSNHFKHHVHLLDEADPEMTHRNYSEFKFPMPKRKLFSIVFLDLSGFNFIKYKFGSILNLYRSNDSGNLKILVLEIIKVILVFILVVFSFKWFVFRATLLLWLIPYATFFQLLNRLRLYLEHNNIANSHIQTRSVLLHPFFSFFISPYNLGYHAAHHQYPNIPFYNLPNAHEYLRTNPDIVLEEANSFNLLINKLSTNE